MTVRTAKELAEHLSCAMEGDASVRLRGVAGPEWAGEDDLVYVDSAKHLERVREAKARCVITSPDLRVAGKTLLLVERPKLAFVKAAAWLAAPVAPAGVHPTAVIAKSARIGAGVTVGPFAVIEDEATVGDGSEIGAYGFLGRGARVGSNCRLHPRVTLYAGARLGDRVIVHAGAVLGSDGFGYVTDQGRHWKFPQVGRLEVGDDAEIGANATMDRGSLGVTRVAAQAKIDNLVHVAHNVEIGEDGLLAGQSGIAGSTKIGPKVRMAGQSGIVDHLNIAEGITVGPKSLMTRSGQPHGVYYGFPARPVREWQRSVAHINSLDKLIRRINKLLGKAPADGA